MVAKSKHSRRPALSDRAKNVVVGLQAMRVLEAPIRAFYEREGIVQSSPYPVSKRSSARLVRRWQQLATKAKEDLSIADVWEIQGMAIVLIKRGLLPV